MQIAADLIAEAIAAGVTCRAVVADSFYGEHDDLRGALRQSGLGFVMALKPSRGTWQYGAEAYTPKDAARAVAWGGPDDPGGWHPVTRAFRDGHTETWWATDAQLAWWGPDGHTRLVVATTDPQTLPDKATWYLATNLPRPGGPHDTPDATHQPADLTEVVRLYGIRHWIEQSYKQVKNELGWADFQVRSATAIRRHQPSSTAHSRSAGTPGSTNDPTDHPHPPTPPPSQPRNPSLTTRERGGTETNPTPEQLSWPKPSEPSEPGSPHGCYYNAAGQPGPTNRHPANSSNSSTPSATATYSTSIYHHKDDKLPLGTGGHPAS